MKNVRILAMTVAASVATLAAQAQNAGDLLRFSQYNYGFGTARSAAMGGAFTSLGADLSAMSINPAGLGMYRTSEVGFSPSVTVSAMDSRFQGYNRDYSKSKFSAANLGVALNMYEGSGALTSFTFGVGYNKLVDFNTSSLVQSFDDPKSMLNYFTNKVQGYNPDLLAKFPDPFDQSPIDTWGGILAYQAKMLNETSPNATTYNSVLNNNALVDPMLRNVSKGSVGEYAFSGGFNIQNILYLGVTVALQDIYYENNNIYSERVASSGEELRGFNYRRTLIMSGTGVNFKFGATLRPIKNLRIGAAIHTPTFINMEDKYIENMASDFNNPSNNANWDSPPSVFNYNVNSATRLLTGISYSLPGIGIITADYERVWYNGMRINDTGDWDFENTIKNDVKESFRAGNNLRVGAEVIPAKNFFLRGGYAYYDTPMRYNDIIANNQADITSYQNYSGGLGYRFGPASIDLAYIYTDYKYADYELYPQFKNGNQMVESGLVNTKQNRNTFTLSMSVRF